MNNAPAAITKALDEQVIRPLAEYLVGRRPLRQVEHLMAPMLGRAYGHKVVRSQAPVGIRRVEGQVLPGAIEASATIDVGDTVHALALRVERRDGRMVVVALEAPSLW